MKTNNKIIFFIGPSSSGKDTFFAKTLPIYQLNPIILLTTRPMRPGELEGREYYFVSQAQMRLMTINNDLIERRDYNTRNGIWSYATAKNAIDLEHYNYLIPNTWTAFEQFLKFYPEESLVPIYFELDDGERLQRALNREREKSKDYVEMCRRFIADQEDFTQNMINLYKPYTVDNNGSIEETMEQIDDIFVRKLGIERK